MLGRCSRGDEADAGVVPRVAYETGVMNSCELAELVSPRALQVQCGSGDPIFPIAGARRAAGRVERRRQPAAGGAPHYIDKIHEYDMIWV